MIDAVVEALTVGAQPEVRAELQGEPVLVELVPLGEPALDGDDALAGADRLSREHAAALVRGLPHFETRIVHGCYTFSGWRETPFLEETRFLVSRWFTMGRA